METSDQTESGAALCILNPRASGGRNQKQVRSLAQVWAEAAPGQPPLAVPCSVDEALRLLRAAPERSRVVIAGGDGTLQRLLPALVERQHSLVLLPWGTGNDLVRALGWLGSCWHDIVRTGMTAPASMIDLGEVRFDGGAAFYFASSLTLGFDAAVGARAHAGPVWLSGEARYLLATAGELWHLRRHRLRIRADAAPVFEGDYLFASSLNTVTYAGGMPVAPGARLDDGRFDLIMAGKLGRLGALTALPLLLFGQHERHPCVSRLSFEQLEVASRDPVPVALDGEPYPQAREVRVSLCPRALRVVVRP